MNPVKIYSSSVCPYCQMAKALLKAKGVTEINEINIDKNPDIKESMVALTGRRTVPQIFIGDTHVGGFDDLSTLNKQGGLDSLLND